MEEPLRPTPLQYAAALVQVLPPIVGVASGRLLSAARRWTVVWCLGLILEDAVSVAATMHWGRNLSVSYVFLPVTGAIALWALSLWQVGAPSRRALRLSIPLFVAVSIVLSMTADDPATFSLFTAPYHALVLLGAAVWTFVRRSMVETGQAWRQDWFWAIGGLMLYWAGSAAIQPLTGYLFQVGRNDLVHAALNARAGLVVLAFGAITGGMLCPVPPTFSGGSSSSPSSPSGSSSSPSARRW